MTITFEIIRFILPRSSSSSNAFRQLRTRVNTQGSVNMQYFGYVIPDEGFPLPQVVDQMIWYIEWPRNSPYRSSREFKSDLAAIAQGTARYLNFNLTEVKPGEIRKGLESKACEIAINNLSSEAPRLDSSFKHSMHKTFTDCYFAKGFTGGGWGYAINAPNDTDGGIPIDQESDEPSPVSEANQRLGYYILGWDSFADHHAYASTPLFDEEIDKLKPYFAPGTGCFYVKFESHK